MSRKQSTKCAIPYWEPRKVLWLPLEVMEKIKPLKLIIALSVGLSFWTFIILSYWSSTFKLRRLDGNYTDKKTIHLYIINQVVFAFWLVLAYDLLEDRRTTDVIITKIFPLCFKMAESLENLDNILRDWAKDNVQKVLPSHWTASRSRKKKN